MDNIYYNIINGYLEEILVYEEGSGLPRVVFEAMRYGVLGDGKRMRPTLLLGACDMLAGDIKQALPFAAAVEFIHAYSLIHDDLPAMDNDDFRRGRPACHKKFGEAVAILAGDALLNLAFERMLESLEPNNRNPLPETGSLALACRDISRASGYRGMIGGQALEIEMAAGPLDSDGVLKIHRLKTGALIQTSLLVGARLAGANDDVLRSVRGLGEKFGMAFQIMDDLKDAPEDGVNFAMTAGFESAKTLCARLSNEINHIFALLRQENVFLHQYINLILSGDV